MPQLDLVVGIAGRPGIGKSTLADRLGTLFFAVKPIPSHTTRKRRLSDTPTSGYRFLSDETFDAEAAAAEFAWSAAVYDSPDRYGTTREDLAIAFQGGMWVTIVNMVGLRGLYRAAEARGRRDAVRLLYLTYGGHNDECLYQRLKERGDSLEKARLHLERSQHWDNDARKAEGEGLPLNFINGLLPAERVVGQAVRLLDPDIPRP